ncbi:MAG: hypothetical protein R2856_11565 [Caldilineaceae bacterium]
MAHHLPRSRSILLTPERLVGIAGSKDGNPFLPPIDYPTPPLRPFRMGEIFSNAVRAGSASLSCAGGPQQRRLRRSPWHSAERIGTTVLAVSTAQSGTPA